MGILKKYGRKLYLMPLAVLLVGMVLIAMLMWAKKINERQSTNFALASTVTDVQLRAASFHLWFEEAISGDTARDMKDIWVDFDRAMGLLQTVLSGGEGEHGLILEPLREPDLRADVEGLKSLLIKFGRVGDQRFQDPGRGGTGSVLDDRFDEAFIEFQEKARALEAVIESRQTRDETRSRRLFFGLFLVSASIVLAAAGGLMSREIRRRAAENALQEEKDNLEMRVAERTKELKDALGRLEFELVERRRTEDALELERNKLKGILDAMQDGVYMVNQQHDIQYINPVI